MTIYTEDPTGLFLQRVTEQRHSGGVFSVSAEFLRVSGNASLPEVIPSSEGDIANIYPEPTISIGTDGFERVNATGYGIWSSATVRQISLEVGELDVVVYGWNFVPGEPGEAGQWVSLVTESKVGGYLFETAHASRMRVKGEATIPSMSALRVLNFSGGEVVEYNHPGVSDPVPIIVTKAIKNIQVTHFGDVEQVEVVHGIISAKVTIVYPDPSTPVVDAP